MRIKGTDMFIFMPPNQQNELVPKLTQLDGIVFLDGKIVSHVAEADTDEGYVDIYERTGETETKPDGSTTTPYKLVRKHGLVSIIFGSNKDRLGGPQLVVLRSVVSDVATLVANNRAYFNGDVPDANETVIKAAVGDESPQNLPLFTITHQMHPEEAAKYLLNGINAKLKGTGVPYATNARIVKSGPIYHFMAKAKLDPGKPHTPEITVSTDREERALLLNVANGPSLHQVVDELVVLLKAQWESSRGL